MNHSLRPLIAGNWKMHGTEQFAAMLAGSLARRLDAEGDQGADVLICPPAPLLAAAREAIGSAPLLLGAQDCHHEEKGAFTGDLSAAMLADIGCSYVIVGHSERRTYHGEDDKRVCAKAAAAVSEGLVPIVCVGETLEQRESGQANDVIAGQVSASLPDGSWALSAVIAYEPVWAIGTGLTPSSDEIADMHRTIRSVLADKCADAAEVRILYGGSVKPENAAPLSAIQNVAGVLVGGASLDDLGFWKIVQAIQQKRL